MNTRIKTISMWLTIFGTLALFSAAQAQELRGKKVLFVDSYHEGYAWSDGITRGVAAVFQGKGLELKVVRMDTKRNTGDAFKKEAALRVKRVIEMFKPDAVIAADDNASKYLVKAHYKDDEIPFVFCGVNWDASHYGYPYRNATGMIEVTPVPQLLKQLTSIAAGKRLAVLAPDLLTAKKEVANYRDVFKLSMKVYYAKDYEDYKRGFLELQESSDMLLLLSDGGLYNDKIDELNRFVLENTRIPTGSCYDFMAERTLISFAKVAEEQGEYSAETVIKILSGTPIAALPLAKNKKGKLILNFKIAKAANLAIPSGLVRLGQKIE